MDQILDLPIDTTPEEAADLNVKKFKRGQRVPAKAEVVREQFVDLFRVANELRKPRAAVWDTSWALYNGQYDWSGKADWQAKVNIPKVRGVVDKAAGSFRKALIRMKRFYHIESETKLGTEKGFYTMSLLDYWLDRLNFAEEFTTGLKSGLITSTLVYKVYPNWKTETRPHFREAMLKEPIMQLGIHVGDRMVPVQELIDSPHTEWTLGFEAIDPYKMWVGPRNGYRIEKATKDFNYIKRLAKLGVYTQESVDALESIAGQRYDSWREQSRKQEGSTTFMSKYNREIDLYHFWGPVFDEDGNIIAENATYTMAGLGGEDLSISAGVDGLVLLRPPVWNPLMHGKDPYVVGTPYIVPFSTYNRGIVEDITGIVKMITELSNLIIDGAQFDALQAYEIDEDLLTDSRQAKRGVYPGVAFTTKSYDNPGSKSVVRTITTGRVPQLALNVLQFLDREQQLSTSVTNALRGSEIGSDTLGEFQSLTSSANDSLDDAARTVEATCLDEMLEKMSGTVYQYHEDFTLPRLAENFPKTTNILADMDAEERFATMVGGYSFKARGVSVFLDKSQDLQQINSLLQLIGNLPGVMTRINIDELLEQIIVGIGWNPTRLLTNQSPGVYPAAIQGGQPQQDPRQAQAQQMTPQQMMNAQQGAAQGGARNNPGANATAPLGASTSRASMK